MEQTKFLKIAVAALLALNVGLLVFLLSHRPPEPPFQLLIREVQMDTGQQTAYQQLREAHHQQILAHQQKNEDLHRVFFELLTAPAPDSARLQLLADSIAAVKKEEEMITFQHFRAVRALCRPAQIPKFDAVLFEAWQSMRPRPPR
jgi:protein CpxP